MNKNIPPPSYFGEHNAHPDDQRVNQPLCIRGSEVVLSHNTRNPDCSTTPFGAPPGYAASRHPVTPVTYIFSKFSNNAMLLLPPENHADSRPQYQISVSLNCFKPTSYITTVTRGASSNGELVGDFDIGHSKHDGSISFGGKEIQLHEAFSTNLASTWKPVYDWKFDKKNILRWQHQSQAKASVALECKDLNDGTILAKYHPPTKPGRLSPLTQLEISPEGQPRFDEILLSILVVERFREPHPHH